MRNLDSIKMVHQVRVGPAVCPPKSTLGTELAIPVPIPAFP